MSNYATVDGFEQLSEQEVFDISAKHLLKQNKKSLSEDEETCMYRGEGGRMCAAGPFIKDSGAEKCERRDWATLVKAGAVPAANSQLIIELQAVHDRHGPSGWPHLLGRVALKHGLNFNPDI